MDISGTTAAWIGIAAAVVAGLSLVLAFLYWRTLRKVRRAQAVVLGSGREDLVNFAVTLQTRIDELHGAVDELAAALVRVDKRIDGALSRTAIVRYDAYEDVGGQQSASLAFLDASRSGIVVTAIQGRDYARIYVKELERGRAPVPLSPEEQDAVERAMSS
ncbi:MAG: DUF4446 family protein [Thermoleophilia bacterium]|nr:DUF4446 family protein [Thermoleophilia bacterium]